MLPAFNAAPSDDNVPAQAKSKVELDLDGAPFLEEEEAPPPAKPDKDENESKDTAPETEEKPKKSKKKLLLILGPVLLLLGGGAFFFLSGGEPEEVPPGATVVTVPSNPITGPVRTDQFMIDLPAFWVELTDQAGEIRLLNCKVKVPTDHQENLLEFNAKRLIIRDALYYYLSNKDYEFLVDNRNLEALKKDMVSIINEYLTTEKIKEVLLADYIIR